MMPNNYPFDMTESIQQLISYNQADEQQREDTFLTSEPIEVPDQQVAESVFTTSIAAMKSSDREQAYDDIHAIPFVAPTEDEETIQKSLEHLQAEVDMREDNQAYLLAKQSNPDYVNNRDFRLLFLRADRFDAKKAAFRMVYHFQIKMELFGTEKLGRDITQDDFDEDDMKTLYDGNLHLLPTTDSAGRAMILFKKGSVAKASRVKGRRFFYLLMVAARETNSFVALAYLMNNNVSERERESAITGAWVLPTIATGMPIHLAAIHLGYGSEQWSSVESVLKMSNSDDNRIRVRTFQGSVEEWLSSLKSYGIQPVQVPMQSDGTLEQSKHHEMMQRYRVKERLKYPNMVRLIKSPAPFDVLFGRGSPFQLHGGNVRLRRLIADCRKTYDKAIRGQKSVLIQDIVETIKDSGALFLKEDGKGAWIVVDDEAAAKKVGAVFRSLRVQDS